MADIGGPDFLPGLSQAFIALMTALGFFPGYIYSLQFFFKKITTNGSFLFS